MGNIVLLDEITINKIAAGEVIERPAAVVKELVENSIDAGAKNITVEIQNGGIKYIRVTDDGKGIFSDDIEIAFEKHATSKIRSIEDLNDVLTMGFRGEALASVSSVSNVKLITNHIDEEHGYLIEVSGGRLSEKESFGCPKGTTIEVMDLFFNVPARYKFLKKDYTESSYIEESLTKIAIINPSISIKFINNKKLMWQTPGNGDLKANIYSLYGKDIASNLIDVNFEYEGLKISGVIGKPSISRSKRTHQMFFVNGRYIKDKVLSAAVDEGYKNMLPIGKFAFCVLNIEINPNLVDVNVHPAKLEVRFSEESKIFKAIYHAVKDNIVPKEEKVPFKSNDLSSNNFLNNSKESEFSSKEQYNFKEYNTLFNKKQYQQEVENNDVIESKSNLSLNEDSVSKNFIEYSNNELSRNKDEEKSLEAEEEFEVINSHKENVDNFSKNEEKVEGKTTKEVPYYKIIGSVFNTYIIIEMDDNMYIIDQHAAHERVIYERLRSVFYSSERDSQMLLIPEIVELSSQETNIVKNNIDKFISIGYEVEEFGDKTFKIVSVPNLNINVSSKDMFLDLLDMLSENVKTHSEILADEFIYSVSCKAAIKANMSLEKEEIKELLDEMMVLDNPFTCPHGRPTVITMSKYEIERKFLRK